MTASPHDRLDMRLLEDFQRAMPLVERPFAAIGKQLDLAEDVVLARLLMLQASGIVARVGAVVRPNTIGASTLAAISVPDLEVDDIAEVVAAEPGINHVYLRENDWNIWFVATGPDRAAVNAALESISKQTGLKVLDLRLERPYHIDLGFALSGDKSGIHMAIDSRAKFSIYSEQDGDRELVQELVSGLEIVAKPFAELAKRLGRRQSEIVGRIEELLAAGILPRFGIIVRHRALGWRSNAMVVWDVDPVDIDRAGKALAASAGINLCYRRTRHEREWPYNLYCMIHAKTREDALQRLVSAQASAGLENCPRQILFSVRCFKQTGALVAAPREAA